MSNNLQAEVYLEWQKNPQQFVTAMWGLVPQKVLKEHKDKFLKCREK